jgi:heat shock protein HslJ
MVEAPPNTKHLTPMLRTLTIAAALLLPACGKTAVDESDFARVLWTVSEIDGAAPAGKATLLFDGNGNVSGRAPCNSWGANYEFRGKRLKIANIFATRMSCEDGATEQRFFDALANADALAVEDGALVLIDGKTVLMTARE